MMNLENTKVYTTDPEVIRKYSELCGKSFFDQGFINTKGWFNGEYQSKVYNFVEFCDIDKCDRFATITPDQINALHAEKFGKVETPEEAEAFDIMGQDNEQLQNYEMGDRVEWKNGDACVYDGSDYVFVGMTPTFNDVSCIIFDSKNGIEHVSVNKLRKPETSQQREERERLEEIDKMSKIVEMKNGSAGNAYKKYCTALYDAGYRKQKDGE